MAFFYGKNMAIDPTLDPQKIAERNTITQSMDVAGSPDEFAKDPTQLAMGSLKGIKLLTDMFVQPPVSEPSKVFKPFKGADEYDDPNKVIAPGIVSQQPSRVPTGQETNIIPDRGNFNYKETQNEVAQRMVDQGILSNEGLERFRSRGFQSIQNQEELINELQTTLKPKDILYIKGSRGMKMENIIKGVAYCFTNYYIHYQKSILFSMYFNI